MQTVVATNELLPLRLFFALVMRPQQEVTSNEVTLLQDFYMISSDLDTTLNN